MEIDIVGEENAFTIDMAQLNSRFGASGIMGKRLVGSGDLKFQRLDEIDRIKELTGGDRINVEAKFKDSCTIQYNGLLLWCTNELPLFYGDRRGTRI